MPIVVFIIDQIVNETTNTNTFIAITPKSCPLNDASGFVSGTTSVPQTPANKCAGIAPTTSSILNSRETINKKGKNTKISVKGRHDPCVGIRAVPIGEAMMSCVLLDHYLMHRGQCS